MRPAARIRRAAARTPAVSSGTRGRPSNSWPPSSMTISPRTSAARSSGQSTNGSSDAPEGNPIRIAATRVRSRRWTTAFVKWVVPIITASTAAGAPACNSLRSASVTPEVTSRVVGVLTAWTTRASSSRTASVLVPPTSIPIRRFTPVSRKHALELEVVAERARPDVLETFGSQEHRRRRQRDHADALAVAQGLRADRVARDGIQDADEIGRHHAGLAVEPADRELVLECELEDRAAEIVEPVELRGAAQEALGRPAGHVADLAA